VSEKKGERGNVPRLRFPEFRCGPEWEPASLGSKVTKVGSGITPRGGSKTYQTEGRPFVRSQNVGWGVLILDDIVYINEPTHESFSATEVKEGDVFLNITGASIGRSAVADRRVAGGNVNQHVCIIRTRKRELNSIFLNQYLLSEFGQAQIDSFQAGGNRQGLNFAQVRSLDIPTPQTEEQGKIADCLSSIDEVIAAQTQKLDALKAHKNGLMQQLFPAEGETVPKLRFPEFRDAPEWEEKTLGDIVEVASGQVDPKEPPYCNMPHIGGENIESHTGNLQEVRTSRELGLISGKHLFDERDVLYSKIRPALNKVAIPDFQGICSADIYPLRPSNRNLCRQYLAYLLLSEAFLKYAIRHSDRGKIPKVNRDSLLAYELVIPRRPEQEKITDFLSSLDTLIAAEAATLDALKTHKKGLMQRLFPAPDEAQG
jgi:type I restriction enzyme S subunit